MRRLVDTVTHPARWWRAGEAAGVTLVLGVAGAVLAAGITIAGALNALRRQRRLCSVGLDHSCVVEEQLGRDSVERPLGDGRPDTVAFSWLKAQEDLRARPAGLRSHATLPG